MSEPDRLVVDLAERIVPGGFFLHRQTPPSRTPFVGDIFDGGYRHCVTYAAGPSTIREALVEMIDGARRRIFVGVLFLGDAEVRQALERAADRLHGGVYIVAALDNKGLDKAINETTDTMDVDLQTEYRNFQELSRAGIYVRGYPGLHAKFMVVDDGIALVSSANFVTRSFQEIGENGVVITDPAHVRQLTRLFHRLWQDSPWDIPPVAPYPLVRDRNGTRRAMPERETGNGLLWSWQGDLHIRDAIAQIIDSAHEELVLATFSIASMTFGLPGAPARPEMLFEPVKRKVEQGVRVRLLLRARNFSDAARAEATAFAQAGVEVYADRYTHAKCAIADGRAGALFSANLMTTKGLTGGVEVGVRLDDTPALREALRFFEHSMAEADMEFALDPTAGRLARHLYAESFAAWPHPGTMRVTGDDRTWARLTGDGGPALFERDADGVTVVRSGRGIWELHADGTDAWALTPRPDAKRATAAAELLEQWLSPRGKRAAGIRGICAVTFERAG